MFTRDTVFVPAVNKIHPLYTASGYGVLRCTLPPHANTYLCVLWHVEDGVQPLAMMVSGLLLVCKISVGLRQRQEPPDGAQVLPQSAVLRAGVLLPPK